MPADSKNPKSLKKPIKHVMLMAAGTGGHIFPALAVGAALRERGIDVSWLATENGMEHRLVPASGIPLYSIDIQGVRGNGIKRLLIAPFKILLATLHAMRYMRRLKVDAVAGFGGYVSGPGGLAAKLLGIPLIVHEQNAVAGLTNTQLSRIATQTLQAFPDTFKQTDNVATVGNPVRQEICDIAAPETRYAHRTGAINILVIGGSLGAQALNNNIPEALTLLNQPLVVTHQCGQKLLDATQSAYIASATSQVKSNVVAFIDNMAAAYQQADLIICRAGALTVSEVATAGLPAVFIPLPSAVDDHQTVNARYLCDAGAAVLCPQAKLSPAYLAALLQPLIDRDVLLNMAQLARSKAMPNATAQVVERILSV